MLRAVNRAWLLASAALLFGCSADPVAPPPPPPIGCFVGSSTAAPVIEPLYLDVTGQMKPILPGERVPLILPLDRVSLMGKDLFIGVRARNLDGCPLQAAVQLIDTCSAKVTAGHEQPLTLAPMGDGWLGPPRPDEQTSYVNMPACPVFRPSRKVNEELYHLKVKVTDPSGRTAEVMVDVTPYCGEPSQLARCECECSRSYILGAGPPNQCEMPVDAGPACDGGGS
jgi:hypothetical protein